MKKQVLFFVLMLMPILASAQTEINGIYYNLNSTGRVAEVTSVPDGISYEYTGSINIPETVDYEGETYWVSNIGSYAFRGCTSLTSVSIPESVQTIGDYAFDGCSNMTSVHLMRWDDDYGWGYCNLSGIGRYAFRDCTSLTSVSIPETVETIGDYAFDGCDNLVDVYTHQNKYSSIDFPTINSTTFSNRANATLHMCCTGSGLYDCYWEGFGRYEWIPANPDGLACDGQYNYYDFTDMSLEGVDLEYIILDNETCQVGAKIVERWMDWTGLSMSKGNNMMDSSSNKIKSKAKKSFIYADKANFITIPLEINGRKVTRIGEEAFSQKYSSNLLAVYIPESVREIAGGVYQRNMELLDFLDFFNDKDVVCSYNLDFFYDAGAFSGCDNLRTVVVGMKTPITIEKNVFSNYSDATLYVPQGCKEAYENAENWNRFGNIVEYDQEQPVDLSSLTEVDYYLAEVDSIGYNLYTDGTAKVANALFVREWWYIPEEGRGPGEASYDSRSYISDDWGVESYDGPDGTDVDTLFKYSGNVIIPGTVVYRGRSYEVTAINTNAFRGSKNMTSVTLPSTLTTIGNNAFYDCKGLETVIIPEGVTDIGNYAFYNATMMKAVTIPSTISTIGGYAFRGCNKLTSVTIYQKTPITIGSSRFSNRANAILFVPRGSKVLYEAADYWNEFKEIKEVDIDSPILIDGIYYALYEDTEMAVVVKGDSEYTGDIKIPEYIDYQGKKYKVNTIAIKAFQDCSELTSVSIPTTVDLIDDYAFEGCNSLRTVNIPASVTLLGGYAFSGCGNLTSVKVNWTDPLAIGRSRFSNRANAILCVPIGSKSAYQQADYWKEFKAIVESGDVNGDGTISVTDVVSIINYILGNQNVDFIDIAADTNGDGIVNISDVVNLVNAILEQ